MIGQTFKTVVSLGGTVDSSFGKIGSAFNKVMGGNIKSVKSLEREQVKLLKEINKTEQASVDVSFLRRQYDDLGTEIERAKQKAGAFFSTVKLGSQFKGITTAATVGISAISSGASALSGFMGITNNATASMAGLAQSYDMSIEQFQAWNSVAQQAGLNGEHVGDLVEELTNKFGEFKALGEQSTVSDVFGALGIEQSMMNGMAAAEQFEFIMGRLANVGDKQQAASLADQLFGGEGNKLTTYIRNTGKSLNDLLGEQRQFNLLTKEGSQGAVAFSQSFKNFSTVVGSGWAEVSGAIGGALAKPLNDFGISISNFFKKHKVEIIQFFTGVSYVASAFGQVLWTVGKGIHGMVQAIGGWKTVGIALASVVSAKLIVGFGGMIATGFKAVKTFGLMSSAMGVFNAVAAANPIGLMVASVAGLIFAGIQLWKNWDSITGWLGSKLGWLKTVGESVVDGLKTAFSWTPIGMIMDNWQPISDFFTGFTDGIVNIVDVGFSKITGIIDTIGDVVRSLPFIDDDKNVAIKSSQSITRTSLTGNADTTQLDASPLNTVALNAINNASPSKGGTVNTNVGGINIYTTPGQSPIEIAQAVSAQLGGYTNSALFDLPEPV